ncbi:DUF4845 domain-containing protein [Endozoicomonas numazuensis]|uniref:DUF4845 domain-containing protein n=1 Tax=Endozoicomonas numazuensis TaxID=1137799 RepID=A0A081NHP3_9GAMM|nr:DUF4845 domain-containing protein [Endozoicomonas numazuensis]KEQ17966.1 hypothetical protein GZ78_10140 [Endozoicomonas numazuensis]
MTVAKSRQKGLSTLGWLVAILVGGFMIMLTFKVAPIYLDDYAISKVLTSMDTKTGVKEAGVPQVREWLNKGLMTNRIKLAKGESKVLRDEGKSVAVEIDYERRVHLMYNIDLVLTFEHNWNAKSQ